MAIAHNGDILVVNGGDGNMVEIRPDGSQIAKNVDVTGTGGGTLFGLALSHAGNSVYFVNDGNNMLYLFD
jgi:DNA-binding beta-propeller fold protein YncE